MSARSQEGLLSMIDGERYELIPVEITRDAWTAHYKGGDYSILRDDFSFFLPKEGKVGIDFAYITIHGIPGENGLLPAYFEMIAGDSGSTWTTYVC